MDTFYKEKTCAYVDCITMTKDLVLEICNIANISDVKGMERVAHAPIGICSLIMRLL